MGGQLGDLVAEAPSSAVQPAAGLVMGSMLARKSVFIGSSFVIFADSTPRFPSPPGAARAGDWSPIRNFSAAPVLACLGVAERR